MSLNQVTIYLSDGADYLSLLAALVSWFYRDTSAFFKMLFYYLVITSILQFTSSLLAFNYINNWFVYHILGLAEIVFMYQLYRTTGIKRNWLFVFVGVLTLYLADSIYVVYTDLQKGSIDINEEALFVNNYGMALAMLFGVILGMNFLWRTYLREEVVNLGRYPLFYICAGLFFYCAGSFFYYLLSSSITPAYIQNYVSLYSWLLVVGFTYIKLIFIFFGFRYVKNG